MKLHVAYNRYHRDLILGKIVIVCAALFGAVIIESLIQRGFNYGQFSVKNVIFFRPKDPKNSVDAHSLPQPNLMRLA